MKALILAAGMGKRLGKYTSDRTKCMVKVGEKKMLIDRIIEALEFAGISDVVVVVGYKGSKLINYLTQRYPNIKFDFVWNKDYKTTNNIYSFWLAKDSVINSDFVLLESDVIFRRTLIKDMMESPEENLIVLSKFQNWMDGTVVILDEQGNISSLVSKHDFKWQESGSYYKTVNIYKFSREFFKDKFLPFLNAYISVFGKNAYYEEVLTVFSGIGKLKELKPFIIEPYEWYEIDTPEDLRIAKMLFADPESRLEMFKKSYGGYWRFNILDYCYLVNPFFPTKKMIDEFKANSPNLITQYPSGHDVINSLAANFFEIDEKFIIVGNGSSELIRILMEIVPKKVGIIFPTFEEYSNRLHEGDIYPLFLKAENGFHIALNEILDLVEKVNTLVLINPNNPTGTFLEKGQVMKLVEVAKSKGKTVIYDESFVDFVEPSKRFSMISDEILKEYGNLVVIRSIGKSYGVPGLRLGIAATSDDLILKQLREKLPIWNINSFGEYFFQMIQKYRKDYQLACKLLADERDRFVKKLRSLNNIRVFDSQANFVLIELLNDSIDSDKLASIMLDHGIFIKSCKEKKGCNERMVRLSIRTPEDNNKLIQVLKDFLK